MHVRRVSNDETRVIEVAMFYRKILRTCALAVAKSAVKFNTRTGNEVIVATRRNLEVRRAFASDASTSCPTIGEIVEEWSHLFEKEAVSEPVESIEYIVAHVVGLKKLLDVTNFRDRRLTKDQLDEVMSLCQCRLSRVPVQYIVGQWDFRDITLKLTPPTFIPRPETEILVDVILKRLGTSQRDDHEILEIGCGSGAISLSLAHSSNKVKCLAIDTSHYACDLSRENSSKLGLQDKITIVQATLEEDSTIKPSESSKDPGIDFDTKTFDFIVSNPPYVSTKDIRKLQPEIKLYEDLRALDGGEDGLKVIRPLLKYSAKALKLGGHLFLEVDPSHPEYISFFVKKYTDLRLKYEHTYKDFCNKDRFVEISKLP